MNQPSAKEFIPVMLTPFNHDGSIDLDGLTHLTEWYLAKGAKGLFANCQSSEMYELEASERLQVISHVVRIVNSRVPVVAVGNFGNTIEQQALSMQQVYEAGVSAVIAVTGLIAAKEEPDALFDEKVFRLFDLTGSIPLGFYECPQPYKRILSAKQLGKFVSTGRVIYLKDTCLDIEQIRSKLASAAGSPAFGLYDAYIGNAVASLKAGAAGLSCIQGNFFPELIVWLCDHYNDAALTTEVERVQQFLTRHTVEMHFVYPLVAKYFLHKSGMPVSTYTRTSAGNFTPEVKDSIDRLITDCKKLKEELSLTGI